MYPVGVVTLSQLLWEHELSSFVLVSLGLFLSIVSLCRCHQCHQDTPAFLPRFFLFNPFTFFRRCYDFFVWGFQVTGQRLFQFRLPRQVRKDFFNAKRLDLQEGFVVLSGAVRVVDRPTKGPHRPKKISALVILEVLHDGRRLLQPWEKAGTLDPFDRMHELIFQTIIRCLTCTEIADDPEILARLRQLFDKVDRGTTPATVLFPWFPSPAMIYDIIVNAIKVRKQSSVSHDDNLQLFLDSGDEVSTIVGFMIAVMAGARWRDEARGEVESLISLHALETISACDSPLPSSTALSPIPLTAWENETPVMDMLIRETLRIAQPHTAARRNVGAETYIDGKVIPTGTLVVYPFSDVHLNPVLYPDPWRFDPTRPQLQADSYVGWGGGKVTCPGSRTAKLTMKLITALLLLDFDFDTVDESGRIADPHLIPNWNDDLAHHHHLPCELWCS
ncbi:cytochrome P450 [Lactarius pseudohatsudake]|nr:cytochrome P450 [Lactarius pseudohatsudake]